MNKGKKCKLIVLDVDGTLLDSEGQLSQYTKKALREFIALAGYVILATGKLFGTIKSLCRTLSLKTKQIVANGSIIVDRLGIFSSYGVVLPSTLVDLFPSGAEGTVKDPTGRSRKRLTRPIFYPFDKLIIIK